MQPDNVVSAKGKSMVYSQATVSKTKSHEYSVQLNKVGNTERKIVVESQTTRQGEVYSLWFELNGRSIPGGCSGCCGRDSAGRAP